MGNLTEKQRKFAENYYATGNGTQAYINAYKNNSSRLTAGIEASKMLKRPDIRAYLDTLHESNMEDLNKERKQVKAKLWSVVNGANSHDENVIRACDILNKMNNEYK